LDRGLQVLRALQASPISSLHDIHLTTRISKPTLLRILHTLERAGLVTRRLADGHYRLSAFTGVIPKRDRHDRVAEAAAPVLLRLCEKVKWECDLHVPVGDHMERRETTRAHTPFRAPVASRDPYRFRVGWLMTAVGRAYLAWCPEKERERILERLRKSDKPWDRLARDPKRLDKILSDTRRRGYATRDPGFVGATYDNPSYDDGLAAIAVALSDGTRAYGSINMLWIRTVFTVEEFASRYLADLQGAAHEIVTSLQSPTNRRSAP
jgi:IclR family mhp operon transcriptional activator